MEVGNSDLMNIDIFNGALTEMGFDDRASMNGLLDKNMFNNQMTFHALTSH
jgi:hypothetical protein